MDDRVGEACGVFGVYAPGQPVAKLTYFGLFALQHRGQESAGIAVSDGETITVVKDMGLVTQVFDERRLAPLEGHLAIGQVRYSTTGKSTWRNAQPVYRSTGDAGFALGHNGNLTNTIELAEELGLDLNTIGSDSDVMGELLARAYSDEPRSDGRDLEGPLEQVLPRLRGAFSLVLMDDARLIGVRDPNGFRPLVLGRLEGGWVLASETAGLDIVGAVPVREIEPAEMIVIDASGVRSRRYAEPDPKLCLFEFVYFARPDSEMRGHALHEARVDMGRQLAREAPIEADVVIAVPDSGTPAAIGFSMESGIPFGEGLVKNRYVGRTFIQPDQALRERGVRMKYNVLPSVLRGKRVVVVDDSIVRGSTTRKLVTMLLEAGALEVHLRISSPPIISPCFYGIDMADQAQLIAAGREVEDVREALNATSLAYLSLDGLQSSTGEPAERFCRACLTGEYPTAIPEDLRLSKLRFEQMAAEAAAG